LKFNYFRIGYKTKEKYGSIGSKMAIVGNKGQDVRSELPGYDGTYGKQRRQLTIDSQVQALYGGFNQKLAEEMLVFRC
jgi:hypothetical protein